MLRSLLQLKPRDVPLRVALRNSAAVVVPLAIGVATDHAGAGLGIAAGALNTMFLDQPGPYRLRMQRMLLTAIAAGISAFVGCVLGASTPWMTLAALAWGIAGGLLVALGPNAGRAGLTSMILLVVTAATPRPGVDALVAALLIFAGGLLQMLLAVAAWPLQRYRPERHALAALCAQLARNARQPTDQSQAPPVTEALLDVESLLHGSHRARGDVMDTFRVLAGIVERIRRELIALGDLERSIDETHAKATIERLREYAARTLLALSDALERGATPLAASAAMEGFDSALAALEDMSTKATDRRSQRKLVIALARANGLAGQLRAALRNADIAGSRGDLRAVEAEARLPRAMRPRNALAILRANFTLSSIAFRHAIRCGVCLAIAVAGERALAIPHGFWIPMTAAIVLKPDFAGTFSFGLLRVVGTLLGLVLTTALVHYAFGTAWERLALLALLSIGFRLLTTVHYGIGVTLLTGLVVILLSFDGVPPGETMLARGIATAIGSALALAGYVLWPSREEQRVPAAIAAMIDAYRRHLAALLQGDPVARAGARSAARSARTNAQASLERLRGEPRHDRALLALGESLFANANRFIRAGMALEAVLDDAPTLPEGDAVRAFAARVDANLAAIAQSVRDGSVPNVERLRSAERALGEKLDATEDGRDVAGAVADACDRITDSVDTLAHLLRQRRHKAAF
ncbi:MAG TPA: FUSC family protein [Rhodanobacteraceae bacterium]|nr:FUSC family protein [Rhodanobacteraceae bacterium]